MTGGGEDRGVSEVIGFILVFSFVVIAFTFYQGIVVPDQNRVAEFEHNQMVQGQLQDLRNAIMSAATGGTERTVSINLGAEYPRRALARNLGYSGGAVATAPPDGAREISVANASAVDRFGETADYWNGSTHRYETTTLVYQPVYSHYSNAPVTIYENTLSYNRFGNGVNLSITGESIVDGKRITLVSLVGNLSESGTDTVTIDPEAISASTQRISVRNETEPVNVTIPTRLNASWWNDTLSREHVSQGGHVTEVKDTGANRVTILLQPGVTYTLRMAKIGVGSSERDEPVKYLTLSERPSKTVFQDTSHSITVQARDRFNNPASGVRVNASVWEGDGNFSETTITTGTEGAATFNFSANTTGAEKLRFNVTPGGAGQPPHEVVWVNLSVKSSSGGDDSGNTQDVNPSGEGSVVLQSSAEGDPKDIADLTFDNNVGSEKNVTEIRVPFYFADSQDQANVVDSFGAAGSFNGSDTLGIGDPLTPLDTKVTFPTGTSTVAIDFNGNNVKTGGDFFILVLKFETGEVVTYFVAPS